MYLTDFVTGHNTFQRIHKNYPSLPKQYSCSSTAVMYTEQHFQSLREALHCVYVYLQYLYSMYVLQTKHTNQVLLFLGLKFSGNLICFLSSVGMLSKAKGLILRVAGVLHVLFHLGSPVGDIPQEISTDALKAAENYVDVCCQHVGYIAGRGDMQGAILQIQKGLYSISFKFMYKKKPYMCL